jgi:hypothetical protein
MVHQRTGTRLLTAEEQRFVRGLLQLPPIGRAQTSGSADTRPPWDAWIDQSERKTNGLLVRRLVLDVTAAMRAELDRKHAMVEWQEKADRLTMAELVGPATAAKELVDGLFGQWLANAVLSPQVAQARTAHRFRPDDNLLDVTNAAARKNVMSLSSWDLTKYIANQTETVRAVMTQHHFYPYSDRVYEAKVLENEILDQFAHDNPIKLGVYDRFGFALSKPESGKIFVSGAVRDWKRAQGLTATAVRDRKWQIFGTVVHEYIHLLEHPALPETTNASMVVREGFCEYLTRMALTHLGELFAHQDRLDEVTRAVEGDIDQHRGRQFLSNYRTSEEYAPHIEAVQVFVQRFGVNAVPAAYFQGHAEFFGRTRGSWVPAALPPQGEARPTPTEGAPMARVLKVTGLSESEVRKHNPGFPDSGPFPEQLYLPGFHGHLVVTAGGVTESLEQIARQNGVPLATLQKIYANERAPRAGEWLIVPDAVTT